MLIQSFLILIYLLFAFHKNLKIHNMIIVILHIDIISKKAQDVLKLQYPAVIRDNNFHEAKIFYNENSKYFDMSPSLN